MAQDLKEGRNIGYKEATHPTVFKELLDSDLSPQEKTINRLQDEGVTMIGAGQETVKLALTMATFYLLQSRIIWQKLRQEILVIFPNETEPPNLVQVEKLPYLTAVIREGGVSYFPHNPVYLVPADLPLPALRLSYGTVSRLPRVAVTSLKYGKYLIPAGTPMSMNHYCAHHDETLFPNSHAFMPERWLNNPQAPPLQMHAAGAFDIGSRPLSRYLLTFSKGPRMCIGMHLAYAQMYIVLTNVVRRCELEMFETEFKDVGFMRDMFVPHPQPGTKGLRVLVKEVRGAAS